MAIANRQHNNMVSELDDHWRKVMEGRTVPGGRRRQNIGAKNETNEEDVDVPDVM